MRSTRPCSLILPIVKEFANILSQCGEKEFYQKLTFLENVFRSWRDGESIMISKDPVGPFECHIENVAAHVDVKNDGIFHK